MKGDGFKTIFFIPAIVLKGSVVLTSWFPLKNVNGNDKKMEGNVTLLSIQDFPKVFIHA